VEKISRENRIKKFMDNFEILNVYFYPIEKEVKGYVEIKIENKILEYDFEYGKNDYEPPDIDFTRIEKMYDRKTNKVYDSYKVFDELNSMLSVHKKDEELYKELKFILFNEYFTTKIEKKLTNGLANKYKEDIDITSVEIKSFTGKLKFHCKISLFGREMEIEILKSNDFYSIQNMSTIDKETLGFWFFSKIINNIKNEKYSSFYVGKIVEEECSFENIIGNLVLKEYKKTAHYKMAVLYDPKTKRRLE
jgi:hypothetical protein